MSLCFPSAGCEVKNYRLSGVSAVLNTSTTSMKRKACGCCCYCCCNNNKIIIIHSAYSFVCAL
jgi:hypothetical protein